MHISNRLKNRLRMRGVRYMMIPTGKVMAGDLGLIRSRNGQPRRWSILGHTWVGFSIKKLGCMVKRPLENVK